MKKMTYRKGMDVKTLTAFQGERSAAVAETVAEIISVVKKEGDSALIRYAEHLDQAKLTQLEVTEAEIESAFFKLETSFVLTLEKAKRNIEEFHGHQKRENFFFTRESGAVLGQKITPLKRVGIYVPGGTAAYPSTVLMAAIPAKIAGVGEIIMVTPPAPDGKVNAAVLAAARVAGVNRIFKVGGAQAVAALAYGTESIPPVDKIVGPGNIYVATAKEQVFGAVDIDMIAGPSEVLIIADESASPSFVAADLLSQAEHDKLSTSILVTDSESLASAVENEVEKQLSGLKRQEIATAAIKENGCILLVKDLKEALLVSNEIAPEHLELAVKDPFSLLDGVENAGSIFLGHYSPEPLGDYMAGPNHTLPTSGTARFSSPLSVDDFQKKSSFIYFSKEALNELKDDVMDFAAHEGLTAHKEAIALRFLGEEK